MIRGLAFIAAVLLVVVVGVGLLYAYRAQTAVVALASPTLTPTASATARPTPTPSPSAVRPRALPESEAKRMVEPAALAAIDALKRKDGAKLTTLAHPDKGVRFSMYAYIRTDTDQVLKPADLAIAFSDPKVRLWGITDGRGDEVRATFATYYATWIYDVDFAKAPEVGYNRAIGSGNTIDNSATVYPDAVMVEFHYPGFDPKYGGMDWRSLRLFFEQKGATWYLVAVVHGQWTI